MFALMSMCPSDPRGAAAFRAATVGLSLKEVAGLLDVAISRIHHWREDGNVPGGRIDKLPAERQRVYEEVLAASRGAVVLPTRLMEELSDLWAAVVLRPAKAALAPAIVDGGVVGSREKFVA